MIVNNQTSLSFTNTDIVLRDPCYIMYFQHGEYLDTLWDEFVGWIDTNSPRSERYGICKIEGAQFLFTYTAHGDGAYEVGASTHSHNNKFLLVDSGLMCVISATDAVAINPKFIPQDHLHFLSFSGTVVATGTGFAGDITVQSA